MRHVTEKELFRAYVWYVLYLIRDQPRTPIADHQIDDVLLK